MKLKMLDTTEDGTGYWRKFIFILRCIICTFTKTVKVKILTRLKWICRARCEMNKYFSQKTDCSIPLQRPRCRWNNNIKLNLTEIL